MKTILGALLVGDISPFGPVSVPSGIDKRPVQAPVRLCREGFFGDAQGDRKRHGGPDKAVHHYPSEHYAKWLAEIGTRDMLAAPGAFGENLSTLGLTEETVAIGDVFRLGSSVIEVSQGRQPCWKLNHRFGVPDMARRVQTTGRTGWYYRVLEDGLVSPGDTILLLDRRLPDWSLRRLWHLLYVAPLDRDELAGMAALPGLPESWRRLAEHRLSTRTVEDWSPRLDGTPPVPTA
ncbi:MULTISPECIES: MOSC domain-containing protein [unclassified Aureimonas]|uniref:MOSC domain-containing protein n=1 Tax=unclassified Aureimonas TaxID=2615206 RepID=UPI0006F4FA1B|nr:MULTISPECIES: MOSC domain-containing protein [unclassified Aureimonas]KQT60741.1 hypothetical protein ASG54_25170 [Aureimonas sp. Leaf460]KQT68870.1 hypothetical protein ASG62_18690 [Aureimonas sp. Leaf427]